MLDEDVQRLKVRYKESPLPLSPWPRLSEPLDLELTHAALLTQEIVADLDPAKLGIGWWTAYSSLDIKTRIFLSDYLVTVADAVPTNMVEARVERLELDHAFADYRKVWERILQPGKKLMVKPPKGPYEDLTHFRVQAHLAGVMRAWASALDCVGGCIVGVAGLPTNLVRASATSASEELSKHAGDHALLQQLHDDLEAVEAAAGPPGWRAWLLAMRHTIVHRGRRTITFSGAIDRSGLVEFDLQLPTSPELTDVEASVHAGGFAPSLFRVPADAFLARMDAAVATYIDGVCRLLVDLWRTRRADPTLIETPAKQWKTKAEGDLYAPVFGGFPDLAAKTQPLTGLDVGPEQARRLHAAGLAHRSAGDITPDPGVWR